MNDLLKSKTFWTGVAGVIAAVGGFFTGTLEIGMAINTALTSLIGIFLRNGMNK